MRVQFRNFGMSNTTHKTISSFAPMQVVLIGSGGVATSIVAALAQHAPQSLATIYSRQQAHAEALRRRFALDCPVTDQLQSLPQADLYIVAVSDHAIGEVAAALPPLDGLVVHTSAVTPIECFRKQQAYGVWYPFNSFAREVVVPFEGQKVLYQLASDQSLATLQQWNELMQVDAIPSTLEQRLWLHLAGVLASNCTNRLYTLSHRLLAQADLPSDLLDGLILRTASKAVEIDPYKAQTGPARRHDMETIARHQALLEQLPEELQEVSQLYNLFSKAILDDYPL